MIEELIKKNTKMPKKNILIITIVGIITALASGSGVFLWQKKANEKLQSEAVENAKQEMQAQINELQREWDELVDPAANIGSLDEMNVLWLRDDGKKMCLSGHEIYSGYFEDLSLVESKNADYEAMFTKAGYVKNEKNTNEEGIEYSLDPRIGFEKGDTQCIIIWSKEKETFEHYDDNEPQYWYYVLCAKHTQNDEDNFNDFYSVANTDNTEDAVVCVEKKNDNFAVGGIGFYRTGARWYAHKENGKWVLDLRTQENPPCSTVTNYPESFGLECENY